MICIIEYMKFVNSPKIWKVVAYQTTYDLTLLKILSSSK